MTLEEAARWRPEPERPPTPEVDFSVYRPDRRTSHQWFREALDPTVEKERWEKAVHRARERGLDRSEEAARSRPNQRKWSSRARRNPYSHAEVLLKETGLPFSEIASITGLDIYTVVALKLKMRRYAA